MPIGEVKNPGIGNIRDESIGRRQLAFHRFIGTGSRERAKTLFCAAADGASPGVRQIFEPDPLGNLSFSVAFIGVVHITAVVRLTLPNIFRIGHKTLLSLLLPVKSFGGVKNFQPGHKSTAGP